MNVQLLSAGEDEELCIPPPTQLAELAVNVQLLSAGEDDQLYIPPPTPPMEKIYAPVVELAMNVQLITVGEDDELYIPPPQASKPAATPVAAPATRAPKPGAGSVTVMPGVKAAGPPVQQPAGTAKAGASRTRTAASGNSASCTQCHQDGRKGITPPGHPSVSGMFGNGTAPPKGKAGGGAGKSLTAGGKGKNSAGGRAGKGRREAEDREESRGGHERDDD